MRSLAAVWLLLCTPCLAMAQSSVDGSMPREIGNRAHGFSYQPTPREIAGPEAAAGVRPSAAEQSAQDRALADLDKRLLRQEGLSGANIPNFNQSR